MYSIGDRVLGQWEPEWFYPGVIVGTSPEGLTIQFDDGDRTLLSADKLRPLNIRIASRIYCRWQGGPAYYPGTITAITGSAIEIHYDDGDREINTVSLARFNEEDLGP